MKYQWFLNQTKTKKEKNHRLFQEPQILFHQVIHAISYLQSCANTKMLPTNCLVLIVWYVYTFSIVLSAVTKWSVHDNVNVVETNAYSVYCKNWPTLW